MVTAWHVIEHLEDPVSDIEAIPSLLNSGAIFCFEVPNFHSWQSTFGGGEWFQLDISRHLWHFTPKSLEHLLKKNDFEVVERHTFSFELGPFGMWQTLCNKFTADKQWIFRYLKKSIKSTRAQVFLNAVIASFLFFPAVALGLFSVMFARGGVLRYVVRCKS